LRTELVQRYCLTPALLQPGHRIRLLFGGGAAYPAMLEAIASAREEVLLETFIWSSDENGRRFVDAVCIKAQEGVQVRCVIDGAGSFGFSGDDVERMRAAGVKLSIFHPVGPWRRHWGWQVRDHRKLLMVDHRVAFTGGMNIGNEYAPVEWGGGGWNDVHARVEGPVLRDLHRLFELTWHYAEPETWEAPPPRHRPIPRPPDPVAIHGSPTLAQALAMGRSFGRHTVQHHLLYAIAAARERIWIQAAYFIPNSAVRGALKRAARRGVDVRVMVPRNMDVPGLSHASRNTWTSLMQGGVRIFEWLPNMLHAKTLCIDAIWSTVGSYNLDARSLNYNWEVALEVVDAQVAVELQRKFERDLERCAEVNQAEWRQRGLWQKIREPFFYFFRLWL
jgi:cardiolipin synthase